MQEIFNRQRQLNIYTLQNIGIDFDSTMADPEQIPVWLENYRKALSAELAELVREVDQFGFETRNAKVELVDILHFLVSLSLIVHLQPPDLPLHHTEEASFATCIIKTFLALDDLQNSIKWKWWAQGGGFKPDRARHAVLQLWECFARLCALFHLDHETLKKIYIAKNQVNFARQDRSYNEDTKTEADNLAMEV